MFNPAHHSEQSESEDECGEGSHQSFGIKPKPTNATPIPINQLPEPSPTKMAPSRMIARFVSLTGLSRIIILSPIGR